MADTFGIAYPGIQQIENITISFGTGLSPGAITITMIPQPPETIAAVGDLVLTKNNTELYRFVDCAVDSASYRFDRSGFVTELELNDFRWKWRFSFVSGAYNVPDEKGNLLTATTHRPNSKVSVEQILKRLLATLGLDESDFTLDLPPDLDEYPELRWDATPTITALSSLLSRYGLVVAPTPDGKVLVAQEGEGDEPPAGHIEQQGGMIDVVFRPEKVVAASAPIVFRRSFELEPVVLEDEKVVSLDEWSYYDPEKLKESPIRLSWIPPASLDETRKSLFRWYRIKAASFDMPLFANLHTQNVNVMAYSAPEDAPGPDTMPPKQPLIVGGLFYRPIAGGSEETYTDAQCEAMKAQANTVERVFTQKCDVPFSFDQKLQLVRFSERVFALDAERRAKMPCLFLLASFTAITERDDTIDDSQHDTLTFDAGSKCRLFRSSDVPNGHPGLSDFILADYIQPFITPERDNIPTVQQATDKALAARLAYYSENIGYVRSYADWPAFTLNGAFRTFVLTFSQSGASARASFNTDFVDEVAVRSKHRDALNLIAANAMAANRKFNVFDI